MDVLQEARDKIEQALAEISEEQDRLRSALSSLAGGSTPKRRGRPPGRPSAASSSTESTATPRKRRKRRKTRKRSGGTRADHAVALIEEKPGITASQIAKKLKIKPNYLHRVLGDLEKAKRLKKDGRQYFPPAETAA